MCPISFNIWGMKINEVHFSLETVIIHFLDKPYYLNSILLCKLRKILSDLVMFRVILFHFT